MNISKVTNKDKILEINLAGIIKIGKKLDEKYMLKLVDLVEENKIEKIIIKGNDPFNPNNLPGVNYLLESLEIATGKHIVTCIYTNYTLESLLNRSDNYILEILTMTDILYERSGKDQRIIDINETVKKLDKQEDLRLENGLLDIIKYKEEN